MKKYKKQKKEKKNHRNQGTQIEKQPKHEMNYL